MTEFDAHIELLKLEKMAGPVLDEHSPIERAQSEALAKLQAEVNSLLPEQMDAVGREAEKQYPTDEYFYTNWRTGMPMMARMWSQVGIIPGVFDGHVSTFTIVDGAHRCGWFCSPGDDVVIFHKTTAGQTNAPASPSQDGRIATD